MRPYLKMFGLVVVVYGVGALFAVIKRADATDVMDWSLFFESGTIFIILVGVGVGMMIKASLNDRADRAAKQNVVKK